MSKEFALKLKSLRKESKMTQQELANKLQVGRSTVSEYERGVIEPKPQAIVKLADIFGVSINYLMEGGIFWERTVGLNDHRYDVKKSIQDVIFNIQDTFKVPHFEGENLDETQKRLVEESLKNTLKILEISIFE